MEQLKFNIRSINKDWKQIVRERDRYQCIYSQNDTIREHTSGLNVHHVLPKMYGGKDEPSNGVLLCRNCHASMHTEFEQLYFSKTLGNMLRFVISFVALIFGKPNDYKYYKALKLLTGADYFRQNQKEIIKDIYEKRKSVLVVMPTGAGKSVIYQIPGLLDQGQSLVISPLISLMTDQVKKLQSKWIPCTYINSQLTTQEKSARVKSVINEAYKFVFAHPKQFLTDDGTDTYNIRSNNQLLAPKYKYFVVDEAHLIDVWGKAFIREYSMLIKIRNEIGNPPMILLSATASTIIQNKIISALGEDDVSIYVTGFYRPEIKLDVVLVETLADKNHLVEEIINNKREGKIIIYVQTINTGQLLYDYLKSKNYDLVFYHGKLSQKERVKIQMTFMGAYKPEKDILIATSAFGMGIDIPNIRHVIHFSMPGSIVDYYQQLGRAGRDGKDSFATLLYKKRDEELNFFLNEKTTDKIVENIDYLEVVKSYNDDIRYMLEYINSPNKWKYITDYFGEKPLSNKEGINFWLLFCWVLAIITTCVVVTMLLINY